MTEVITVDPVRPDAAEIARAADCLRRGDLVAFPTETVYGLGAHALDLQATLLETCGFALVRAVDLRVVLQPAPRV